MKLVVFISFFLLFGSSLKAHDFYFAFAEVEYNEKSKKLEVSLEMTAHDMEYVLRKEGITILNRIEDETKNPTFKQEFEIQLNKGFELSRATNIIQLRLIGYEVLPNGLLYAYLESEPVEISEIIHVRFNLLMNYFADQQNKITFEYKKNKQTAVFLQQKQVETLILQ